MTEQQTPPTIGRPGFKRVWLFCLVGICIVAAFVGIWLYAESRPVHKTGKHIEFIIRPGEGTHQVAQELGQKSLIRSPFVFRLYLWKTGGSRSLQAGRYLLQQGTSIGELALIFERGRVTRDVVSVVIPEGFTVNQVADRLESGGVCTAKAFTQSEEHDSFSESFLKAVPYTKHVKYRYEGYLFPATYEFERHSPAHLVVDEMLQTFDDHWQSDLKSATKRENMSLSQVMVQASLIEKEAKVNAERPIIASVIHNRLVHRPPMNLQIDATLEYILGYRSVITDKDLKVNDRYNTYQFPGLPPGPICNPGLASIDAVLHRANTPYLFYVVKNDKSGEHYFSSTYAEQLKNENRSQMNLRKYTSH